METSMKLVRMLTQWQLHIYLALCSRPIGHWSALSTWCVSLSALSCLRQIPAHCATLYHFAEEQGRGRRSGAGQETSQLFCIDAESLVVGYPFSDYSSFQRGPPPDYRSLWPPEAHFHLWMPEHFHTPSYVLPTLQPAHLYPLNCLIFCWTHDQFAHFLWATILCIPCSWTAVVNQLTLFVLIL